MKKIYLTPEMALYKIELQQMLATSGSILDEVDTGTGGFEELGREFVFDDDSDFDMSDEGFDFTDDDSF